MADQLKPSVEREVSEELAFHLDMQIRDLVAQGVDPAAARAAALAKMGDLKSMRQRLTRLGRARDRVRRRSEWWREFAADLRFGVRTLIRKPGFAVVAVVTLALGIGATTAIFSVLQTVVLRPFPVAEADRLVMIAESTENGLGNVSVGNYADMNRAQRSFASVAAGFMANVVVTGSGEPERVIGGRVTASFFQVFNQAPLHGRVINADDDQPGRAAVAVLSHRFFTRRFAGDRAVVGQPLVLDGVPHTIVGVMGPSYNFLDVAYDVWVPAAFTPAALASHDGHFLDVFAKLRPGVTVAQANGDLEPVSRQLRETFPNENSTLVFRVAPIVDVMVGETAGRIYVLFGAVCLVLMIGCVNVANLLLARGNSRGRELAVRAALGAGRRRLVRQLFVESLALALGAGIAGVAIAWVGVRLLLAGAPENVPRLDQLGLNWTGVGFAFLAALVSALIFGLLPAVRTAHGTLLNALRQGSRGASGVSQDWLKRGLVAVEVGLSLVLLVGAGLLIRTAIHLGRVDPGFDPNGVLSARVSLPATGYQEWGPTTAAFRRIAEDLKRQPGVVAAALSSQVPMGPGGGSNGLIPEGQALEGKNAIMARLRLVTPDYLKTMRISLVRGRDFTAEDGVASPRVAIVNETWANKAFPGQDPIGKRFVCCEDRQPWKEIVGVVGNVRADGIAAEAPSEFYLPIEQAPPNAWNWIGRTMTIAIRTHGAPAGVTATLQSVVRQVDPAIPVFQVATMDQRIGRSLAESRFNTQLLTILGLVGLVLAAVGIYGVVAFMVARRTREIGIRAALGASRRTIRWLVLKDGMIPVAIGIAVGTAVSLGSARLLSSQLRGVSAHDPLTIVLVALGLVAVAATAMLAPAAAAVRVDPTIAMRDD